MVTNDNDTFQSLGLITGRLLCEPMNNAPSDTCDNDRHGSAAEDEAFSSYFKIRIGVRM